MNYSNYAKAYTEVLEIIKYFPEEDYVKIPVEKIEFIKNNMDKNYKFTINPEIDLAEQNISREANEIIINLYKDYYATEEQKFKIDEILEINEEKSKREKYNPDKLFEKTNEYNNTNIDTSINKNALITYKESFFTKFKNFIFRLLHIN